MTSIDITALVQNLGFPIATALALGWFTYRNWTYTTRKLDERDAQFIDLLRSQQQVSEQIIETQKALTETQSQALEILRSIDAEINASPKHKRERENRRERESI